jgi:hypothetical protein
MNKELEKLLKGELLSVPNDFTERVMNEINRVPMPVSKKTERNWLQWLVVMCTGSLGLVELFSFIFGIWTATAAY